VTTTLSRTAAAVFAVWLAGAADLPAAEPPASPAPEARPSFAQTIAQTLEKAVEKADEKVNEKVNETIVDKIGAENVERIDYGHEVQSQYLGELFNKVDKVFGEEYVADRERKVEVRAGLQTTFNNHGTSTDTAVKIGLRVPLPALKRRVNAFIDFGEDVDQLGEVSNPNYAESDKTFSVGAGLIKRLREDLEAGLKLRLLPGSGAFFSLYPFVRFEEQPGQMRYFFEQQVIWDSDGTWNSKTFLDVDRRFGSGLLLRLSNSVTFDFEDPGATIAHGLILRYGLFAASGVSLELWLDYNTAKDNPETVTDDTVLSTQLRLRGRIWRRWLEYELRPIYSVPLASDRNSFLGFFISLSVLWDSYLGGGLEAPPIEGPVTPPTGRR
jgi:hypothetical protein